ncbi:MAG TPA: very short patch repair endonuclease [Acidimicrobiales bacterium]|nr:very short patch repair endonuclease [Acidimicrobiales bacterium]
MRRKMSAFPRRDTSPELALRRELHRRGLRYFVHRRPIPTLRRQADVVFPRMKVAVFVDGCFWHGCVDHGRREHRTNGWYWPEKIQRNFDRDRDTDLQLVGAGWAVFRVWEHDDPAAAAEAIRGLVRSRIPEPLIALRAGLGKTPKPSTRAPLRASD